MECLKYFEFISLSFQSEFAILTKLAHLNTWKFQVWGEKLIDHEALVVKNFTLRESSFSLIETPNLICYICISFCR